LESPVCKKGASKKKKSNTYYPAGKPEQPMQLARGGLGSEGAEDGIEA